MDDPIEVVGTMIVAIVVYRVVTNVVYHYWPYLIIICIVIVVWKARHRKR